MIFNISYWNAKKIIMAYGEGNADTPSTFHRRFLWWDPNWEFVQFHCYYFSDGDLFAGEGSKYFAENEFHYRTDVINYETKKIKNFLTYVSSFAPNLKLPFNRAITFFPYPNKSHALSVYVYGKKHTVVFIALHDHLVICVERANALHYRL